MLPKPLKRVFDTRSYATLKDFSESTGIEYSNVLRRVQRGDIPAINVAPRHSKRACWRMYEEQLEEWFANRVNTRLQETVAQHPVANVSKRENG
jgi:hypothetical protein